ncbi:hypothetical protein ACFOY2_38545 [Nonomuraea purpurea]|uniref:Uncharacterized protein n=1 Tax=Nonomuraea purpurea TaxID=1849276 RepID=A0ABV8GJR0_9ACTN
MTTESAQEALRSGGAPLNGQLAFPWMEAGQLRRVDGHGSAYLMDNSTTVSGRFPG